MTTAIVLATPVPGADPLDAVAGLPLALRAALALERAGARRLILVVAEGDARVAEVIQGDRRLGIPVTVIEAAAREEGLARAEAAAGGPALVAAAEVVVDPGHVRAAVAEGRVGPVEVGARWAIRADTREGRRRAEDALLEACRKPVDGLVARYLNRRISLAISRRLAGTRITPNAVTAATLAIALAGAAAAARGGHGPMLLGAALLQLASILDGVDGELARLRYEQSRLGQWLDTVVDDVSTLAFYAGVTLGATRDPAAAGWALPCGAAAMAGVALTSLQYYAELARLGAGDFYALDWDFVEGRAGSPRARAARLARLLLKRDLFTLLYLALAAAGALPAALVIGAVGHTITLVAATARTLRRLAT